MLRMKNESRVMLKSQASKYEYNHCHACYTILYHSSQPAIMYAGMCVYLLIKRLNICYVILIICLCNIIFFLMECAQKTA